MLVLLVVVDRLVRVVLTFEVVFDSVVVLVVVFVIVFVVDGRVLAEVVARTVVVMRVVLLMTRVVGIGDGVTGWMTTTEVVVVCARVDGREVVICTGTGGAIDEVGAMLDDEGTADVVTGLTTTGLAADEETTALEVELGVTLTPPKLAHAKPIFVTLPPLLLGLLKSHTILTYGQHTLSTPTLSISPLTVTSLTSTTAPTFLPALSTT